MDFLIVYKIVILETDWYYIPSTEFNHLSSKFHKIINKWTKRNINIQYMSTAFLTKCILNELT